MSDIDNSKNTILDATQIKLELEDDDCSRPSMAVATITEEILNYDEIGLKNEIDVKNEICDNLVGDSDYYEFADTSLPEDTESRSSDAVSLLVDSTLNSYFQIYKDVNSSFKNNSKSVVKLLLADNKDDKKLVSDAAEKSDITDNVLLSNAISLNSKDQRECWRNQSLLKPVPIKKNTLFPVSGQLDGKTKLLPATEAIVKPPGTEYRFKCSECTEQFELKSHLVMHEITHENYKKYYQSYRWPYYQMHGISYINAIQSKYTCTMCKTSFQLRSQLENHELSHMKQNQGRCYCTVNKMANDGDLCTCNVRDCKSCSRKFFASIKLGNWENCIKCFNKEEKRELNSHLLVHEMARENHNKHYQSFSCTICKITFQLKSQLENHELSHLKRFERACLCIVNKMANDRDLCTCIVRDCRSCSRKFFASIKLGNWTNCIKCFNNEEKCISTKVQGIKTCLPVGNKQIKVRNSVASWKVVRKVCSFCGKITCNYTNNCGSLRNWMCSSCRNARLRANVAAYRKFERRGEHYRMETYPVKTLLKDHNWLRKSIYFEEENKIGQHFLLSSLNIPHEPSSNDDKNEDSDDEMVIDITPESAISDSSPPAVILCDKTGELIDLTKDPEPN